MTSYRWRRSHSLAAASYGGSSVSQRSPLRFCSSPRSRRYTDGRPPRRPLAALVAAFRALVRLPRATACGFLRRMVLNCDAFSGGTGEKRLHVVVVWGAVRGAGVPVEGVPCH